MSITGATLNAIARIQALTDAIAACEAELYPEPVDMPEDAAYNRGVRDCIAAIEGLRG